MDRLRSSEIDAALVPPEENDAVCAEVEAWLRATLTSREANFAEAVPLEERPYSLDQLLKQCDPQARQSEELKAWNEMRVVGREVVEYLKDNDVWEAAERVFGDKEKARRWMKTPLKQLNDRSPIEVLNEDPQQVHDLLIRIEHRVYI